MAIEGIQFLHTALLPNDFQTFKLDRGNVKHGVESLQEVDKGVLMNGRHLFPWSVIMRVDYTSDQITVRPMNKGDIENLVGHRLPEPEDLEPIAEGVPDPLITPEVAAELLELPKPEGVDLTPPTVTVIDIRAAPPVLADVQKLEGDLYASRGPKKPNPTKKRGKRKPTT